MREILFRGKRIDNGGWVKGVIYGEYMICGMTTAYYDDEIPMSKYSEFDYIEVFPETVGQYTGLTDKNGTRIFEGDIVLMPSYQGGKHRAVVYFKNGKFAVNGSNYHFKDIKPRNIEVIGNIFDNHELL